MWAAVLVCGVLSTASARTNVPTVPPALAPGEAREGHLAGGRADPFTVEMAAGQFARLTVEQRGLDIMVAVLDPSGSQILEVDVEPSARGSEDLAWIADVAGPYRVELRPVEGGEIAGFYTLRLEELREPTAQDRDRALTERRLSDGYRLRDAPDVESQRKRMEILEGTLPLFRALGDRKKEATALLGMARVARRLSDLPRAVALMDEALSLCQAHGYRALEPVALGGQGLVLLNQGSLDQAIEKFEAALISAREVGSRTTEATVLTNLAEACSRRWDHDRAAVASEQALVLARRMGDQKQVARILGNMGGHFQNAGNPQKAIELYQQVLPLHRELKERWWEASVLVNIGTSYFSLGDTERALRYHEDSLKIWRELGDRSYTAHTLDSIGRTLDAAGELDRARASYMEALALAREVGLKSIEARARINLGDLHRKTGDRVKARELTEEALAVARRISDRNFESGALVQLARIEAESGELEAARRLCREGVSVSRQLAVPRWQVRALFRLADIERARGDLAAAKDSIEEAITIIESQRTRLTSADYRAAYLARVREIYELHVNVLMQFHREQPAGGFAAQGFQAAERARSRTLLELLAEARADIHEGVGPDLLVRERSLRNRLNGAAERQARLAGQPAAAAINREIEGLSAELSRTESEIRATSPRYAALTQPAILSVPEIQLLLGPDTLLLEYFLGEERSFLWALRADSFDSYELPARATIEAAARRTHEVMSQPQADWEGAAAELSRMILGPVAHRLGASRIVLVADGALQYAPFAALPHPTEKWLLVERHEVVGLPSASVLPLLRGSRPPRRTASKTLMAFADPVFDAEDERVRTAARRRPKLSPRAASVSRSLSDEWSVSRARADFGVPIERLPSSRREAHAIAGGLARGQARLALDFEANQAQATAPELEQYRFVHFATHGFLNGAHPELSGLLLSLVDEQGRPQDGFLTTAAIFNLRLSADLVVLSGCQTALGKEVRGEALMGMTRGFMYAGAPRVLGSLWQVDDAATAELMTAVYRPLLAGRSSPAAALREAQLSLRRRPRFQHPFYWAGFQLQGEWR